MTQIKLELFHADWCGHCKNFMPEWKKFANDIKGDKSVHVVDYESSSPNFAKVAKINGKPVEGFPTVKVTVDGTEHVYNNGRTAEALHETVSELKRTSGQSGGARKPMTGGSVRNDVPVQTVMRVPDKSDPDYSRKLLLYKIAKYEHKYNQLYNDLRKKGVL